MNAFLNEYSIRTLKNLRISVHIIFTFLLLAFFLAFLIFYKYIPTFQTKAVYQAQKLKVIVPSKDIDKIKYADKLWYQNNEISYEILEISPLYYDSTASVNYQILTVNVSDLNALENEVLVLTWARPKEQMLSYILKYIMGG